jgi:hypothetical protein
MFTLSGMRFIRIRWSVAIGRYQPYVKPCKTGTFTLSPPSNTTGPEYCRNTNYNRAKLT